MHKGIKISVRTMLALMLALAAGSATVMAAENGGQQGGDAGATGGDNGGGQDGGDDGGGTQGEDIMTVLRSQGDLGQTADAIEQAGLAETLEGQGPFTVFAPTDEAWQQLPEEERNQLMSDAGLSRLRSILSYHVVPDELRADDIQQMGSVTTIQGQPLEVSRDGDEITVNDATVVLPGMAAGNGVVHGIDEVLMPQR